MVLCVILSRELSDTFRRARISISVLSCREHNLAAIDTLEPSCRSVASRKYLISLYQRLRAVIDKPIIILNRRFDVRWKWRAVLTRGQTNSFAFGVRSAGRLLRRNKSTIQRGRKMPGQRGTGSYERDAPRRRSRRELTCLKLQ